MSDAIADASAGPAPRGRSKLILMGIILLAGAGGFAAGFLGFVSPAALLAGKEVVEDDRNVPGFLDVPRIVVPMAGRSQQLVLSIKLETSAPKIAHINALMPRILDTFNRFLSDISPEAIDRRGVLEIIRGELQARVDMILGDGVVNRVLITEFAIQ